MTHSVMCYSLDQIQCLLQNQNWPENSYSHIGTAYISTRKLEKCPSDIVTTSILSFLSPYNLLFKETGSFVPQVLYSLGFLSFIL